MIEPTHTTLRYGGGRPKFEGLTPSPQCSDKACLFIFLWVRFCEVRCGACSPQTLCRMGSKGDRRAVGRCRGSRPRPIGQASGEASNQAPTSFSFALVCTLLRLALSRRPSPYSPRLPAARRKPHPTLLVHVDAASWRIRGPGLTLRSGTGSASRVEVRSAVFFRLTYPLPLRRPSGSRRLGGGAPRMCTRCISGKSPPGDEQTPQGWAGRRPDNNIERTARFHSNRIDQC